jgi:aminopeptidase YwaD
MILRILFFLLLPVSFISLGQTIKLDNSPIGKLKRDVDFLANDKMNGRLTGSSEAHKVAEYIESRFQQIGISSYKGKYKWDFTAKTGMILGKNAYFKLFDEKLSLGKDFIFMPYSTGNVIKGMAMPGVDEENNVWIISTKKIKLLESNNRQKTLFEKAKECISQGASAVVFINDIDATQDLSSLNLSTFEALQKPVAFINYATFLKSIKPVMKKDWIDIDAKLGFEDANTKGENVVAMIDNKSPLSIVVACNYDHIGNLGEVYNGANNNASGVATILQVAEMVKLNGLKRYNYIFIAFAGKEQELQGSSEFLKQNESMINSFSCMIDLDKIGRLDNKSKKIFVSGIGTASVWNSILQRANKNLYALAIDSSGMGYSDQNSFYKKNVPVLNISTGYDEDHLTSKDDFEKINWNGLFGVANSVCSELDKETKLIFSKTNDIVVKLEKTKLNLGVIPDYSFDQNGIRINYCYPNKMGAVSGMKMGDIILKIGQFKIIDFDDYIEAMNKIEKDKEITILVKRDKNEYKFFVTFQ